MIKGNDPDAIVIRWLCFGFLNNLCKVILEDIIMKSNDRKEIILDIGGAGGSITLCGVKSSKGKWKYFKESNESFVFDMLDEEDQESITPVSRTKYVQSIEEALLLLNDYPWVKLCPMEVHPDFLDTILAEVRRVGGQTEVKRWKKLLPVNISISRPGVLYDYKSTEIKVKWDGPYSWPGYESENNLRPIPKISGIYLQTFEYKGGYLIYAAGITRRTIPERFREHTPKYMNGEYNVLDIAEAQHGTRREIWHGWVEGKKHREEFELQKSIILDAVRRQLAGFCIFVADIGTEPRILERLEASIMSNLYKQASPICDIPDKGMHLEPHRKTENKIIVNHNCAFVLHGLPASLEI